MFIVFFTTRILNSFVVAIFSIEARDIDIMVCCLVPKSCSKPISYAEFFPVFLHFMYVSMYLLELHPEYFSLVKYSLEDLS